MNKTQFKLRSMLIFLVFCSLYSIVLFNLYCIQIRNRDFYSNLGTKQYNVTITQTPGRALIYDRHRHPLTLNKQQYSAFVLPKKLEHPETLESFLHKYFPQGKERLYIHRSSPFVFIKRKLTNVDVALIKEHDIQDLHLLQEPNRYYPVRAAGPIVGITNVDNVGLFGIEKIYDTQLVGTPATYVLEKDARSGNFYFTKKTKTQGQKGTSVRLTIDADLQFLAFEEVKDVVERFASQEGAAIIIDPITGDILAAVQYPTFDPNNTQQLDISHTKLIPITNTYEPGSVIKPFVAMAALEEGVITHDEFVDCESTKYSYVNGMKIGTWQSNGILTFSEVIQKSNNIGMAKVAQRLGEKLYDYYILLGFGQKTGVDFLGEHKGYVNPPRKWSKRSLSSLSFGYELTVTLLQIAKAFCVIANNGYSIQPRLVLNPEKHNTDMQQIFSSDVIYIIRNILKEAIQHGTGRNAVIEGFTVMGKTGTSNIVSDGSYDKNRNIFTFAGIVEKGDYKRVIVTMVRESGYPNLYASQVTAPLFVRIADRMIIHERMV